MTNTTMDVRPSEDMNYYKGDVYWNNFDAVNAHTNRLISGRPDVGWEAYTRQRFGVAERGLFVHCGNGWVERDCFRHGLIQSAVGTDVSEGLLSEARANAAAAGLPATYVFADTNKFDFGDLDFDWVFNHAAFHHIAYLDAAVRCIWRAMPANGHLVAYDYTGPHRNQYPWDVWSAMLEFNRTLPAKYRANLRYPHLPTMLATDPSEAVHSELILDVCRRYFDLIDLRPLGGPIAYEVLHHNHALHADQHTLDGAATVQKIIAADVSIVRHDPARSFFNYWVGVPKPARALSAVQLDAWTQEEIAREQAAARQNMRYHPPSALELIYEEMEDIRYRLNHNLGPA